MSFVLDASVVMSWAFPDEHDVIALAALRRIQAEAARVPAVWWFEVRNVLLVNEQRQRISEADTAAFLLFLSALRIDIEWEPSDTRFLMLSRQHRLSAYDTAYLELALREVLPLATLDRKLAAAAQSEGVALIG